MIRKTIAILLLAAAAAIHCAQAQPKGRPDPRFVQPDQIDPATGTQVLEAFRSARTAGDYDFDFVFVNRPRSGGNEVLTGRMLGTWSQDGRAVCRADISLPGGQTLQLLYRGGTDGSTYMATKGQPAREASGEARFAPIADGLTFTPFELQMPFLFWTDYVYEGTRKLMGRPAHYFILYPPTDFESQGIGAVRVAVDADFLVMLMAEELDHDGNPVKDFRINGFKKVDGQWIVKEIDLVDETSKDRTRFKVIGARVGLTLPESLFSLNADGTIPDMPTDQPVPIVEGE